MGTNLPTVRRFKVEDYPDSPAYFANFLGNLNLYTDPIFQVLDGNLGYQNVIAPQIITKTITAPASGSTTFNFTNPLSIMPRAVIVGQVYEVGKPTAHPAVTVQVMWHLSQGVIYIDNVIGLTASTSYVLNLQVS